MKVANCAKENGTIAGQGLGKIKYESISRFRIIPLHFSLSVSWQVQELVAEYALLIKAHFGKLLNYVQQNNWRINSNVLVGARVAVFRKTSTPMPMVITG